MTATTIGRLTADADLAFLDRADPTKQARHWRRDPDRLPPMPGSAGIAAFHAAVARTRSSVLPCPQGGRGFSVP